MKDDVRRAFERMTEAPHPALRSAIRASLRSAARQEARPIRHFAAFGAVAAAVAIALLGAFYFLPRGGGITPQPAGHTSSTPRAQASPSPEPATSPAVSASPTPSAYVCANATGGGTGMANVTSVRVGPGAGYDRFVIQFDGPVPAYRVLPQGSSTFVQDASGQQLVLLGSAGIRVVVTGATANPNGVPSYSGPNDFKPGYKVLAEARQTGDFERNYSWGLGLTRGSCIHVYTLTGPDRLVIDIANG